MDTHLFFEIIDVTWCFKIRRRCFDVLTSYVDFIVGDCEKE